MKRFWLVIAILFPIHVIAGGAEEKTRKLFEVQGVLATYQGVIDQTRAQAQEEARQVMNQMLTQLNPSKEFQDLFSLAAERYMNALMTDRTAEQIVEVLVQYYSTKFSENELDGLLIFYGSDLGKKDAAVSKDSYQYLLQYYKAENERIRITATNDFVKDLQLIAAQCNCAKKSNAKIDK